MTQHILQGNMHNITSIITPIGRRGTSVGQIYSLDFIPQAVFHNNMPSSELRRVSRLLVKVKLMPEHILFPLLQGSKRSSL